MADLSRKGFCTMVLSVSSRFLSTPFSMIFANSALYVQGCKAGWDAYAQIIDGTGFTEAELHQEIISSVSHCRFAGLGFSWGVGFCVGWLSVLTLVNPDLASSGVDCLKCLVIG